MLHPDIPRPKLHSDLKQVLADSLTWRMERKPEALNMKLDLDKLRENTWSVFQRYVERVGQPPDFELLCAQPEFEDLEKADLDGVVRNTYLDLNDIWRRAGFEGTLDPAAEARAKQGLQEPKVRWAAVTSGVNNYRSHLFGLLETDFGRNEALAYSTAIDRLKSLNELYRRQKGDGVAADQLELDLQSFRQLGANAMKDMKDVFDQMAERRKEESAGGMETGKWKSDAVRREREELRKLADMEAELTKVIHHKLPRQFEAKLNDLMTREQRAKLENRLAISGRRELLSLGSNLLLGPKERGDETGLADNKKGIAAFDGTKTEDGTSTPRSQALEQVYDKLYPMLNENRKEPLSNEEFEFIATLLEEAEKLHYQASKGHVLDSPMGRWEKNDRGVYVKKKQQRQDTGAPSESLAALKKRAPPAELSPPKWIASPEGLEAEAQRKKCYPVLGALQAVRVKIAEVGADEAIDTEAVRRIRAAEIFDYAPPRAGALSEEEERARLRADWAKRVDTWVAENTHWAQEQMEALRAADSVGDD